MAQVYFYLGSLSTLPGVINYNGGTAHSWCKQDHQLLESYIADVSLG